MAYPTPTAKRKQTFMLFAYPTGVQGNVVSAGVNELIIPNYKQTWGNIRKIADAPEGVRASQLQVARLHNLICSRFFPKPKSPGARCPGFFTGRAIACHRERL